MKFYKDSIIIEDKGKPLVLNFLRNKLHLTCEWLVSKEDQRKGDIFCKDLDLYIELKVEQKKYLLIFLSKLGATDKEKLKGGFIP
jgi:hypothetical protein